jgi:hypothetical protein
MIITIFKLHWQPEIWRRHGLRVHESVEMQLGKNSSLPAAVTVVGTVTRTQSRRRVGVTVSEIRLELAS